MHNRWIQDKENPAGRETVGFFVGPPRYRSFLFRPTRQVAREYPDSAIGSMIDSSFGS